MAVSHFKIQHFLVRLGAATGLVFFTYNPVEPYSYYEWALAPLMGLQEGSAFSVFKAFVGLLLFIGWAIFIRATRRSLGWIGMGLAVAFFVLFFWLLIEQGWLSLDNPDVLTWLILIGLSGVMALGMSWSYIRRRMSGQLDVDDTEDKIE